MRIFTAIHTKWIHTFFCFFNLFYLNISKRRGNFIIFIHYFLSACISFQIEFYDSLSLKSYINFYFTIQGVWSTIVIVHEKCFYFLIFVFFFASVFRNISKMGKTILLKKIERIPGIVLHKIDLITEHR